MSAAAIKAGSAFVEITARDKKLKESLSQNEKRMRDFARRAAQFGATAALAAAVGGIAAASNLEETLNKFNVVFAENSAAVREWANTFAQEVGRSERQVLEFLGNTQDLLVPLGFEPGAAENLSKEITALAVDVASFNNKLDADVLRDFHAAMTGGGETVKKYGVIVNVATTKQKLLQNSIDPATATEAQKAWARYQIILESTTAAQGDAVRSGDSFANQMKRFKGNLEDTGAALGEALLPMMTQLLQITNSLIVPFAQWLSTNSEIVETSIKLAAAVGAIIVVMRAFTLATQAAAKAQSVQLALMGPKGWAILAGSIAAATIAVVAVNGALEDSNSSLQATDQALNSTTKGMEAQASAADKLAESLEGATEGQKRFASLKGNFQESLDSVTSLMDQQKSSADKLAEGLAVIADHGARADDLAENYGQRGSYLAMQGLSPDELKELRSNLINSLTGFDKELQQILNETGKLTGELTDADILLASMEKKGLPAEEMERLKQALEDLNKAEAAADKKKEDKRKADEVAREKEQREDNLKDRAKEIRDSLKTPAQRFQDLVAEMKTLVKEGVLDRQTAREYLLTQRDQAQQELRSRRDQQDQSITQAASQDLRSSGGASFINRLLNQTSSSEEKIESHTKQTAANTKRIANQAGRQEARI